MYDWNWNIWTVCNLLEIDLECLNCFAWCIKYFNALTNAFWCSFYCSKIRYFLTNDFNKSKQIYDVYLLIYLLSKLDQSVLRASTTWILAQARWSWTLMLHENNHCNLCRRDTNKVFFLLKSNLITW